MKRTITILLLLLIFAACKKDEILSPNNLSTAENLNRPIMARKPLLKRRQPLRFLFQVIPGQYQIVAPVRKGRVQIIFQVRMPTWMQTATYILSLLKILRQSAGNVRRLF